jgi:hypothetical protein
LRGFSGLHHQDKTMHAERPFSGQHGAVVFAPDSPRLDGKIPAVGRRLPGWRIFLCVDKKPQTNRGPLLCKKNQSSLNPL